MNHKKNVSRSRPSRLFYWSVTASENNKQFFAVQGDKEIMFFLHFMNVHSYVRSKIYYFHNK